MPEASNDLRFAMVNVNRKGQVVLVSGDLAQELAWYSGAEITRILVRFPKALKVVTRALDRGLERARLLIERDLEFRLLPNPDGGVILTVTDLSPAMKIQSELGGLISTISHQFRTPLTSIQGALEMLDYAGLTDAQRADLLRSGRRNAAGMIRIVEQLSRWEMDLATGRIWVRSAQIPQIGREIFEQTQAGKSAELSVSADQGDIVVAASPASIASILSGLLETLFADEGFSGEIMMQVRHQKNQDSEVSVRLGHFEGIGWTKLNDTSAENQRSWQDMVVDGQATSGLVAAQLAVASAEGKLWMERSDWETAYCFTLPAANE